MQFDPKWGAALNIAALVLSAVAAGSIHLVGLSPELTAIIQGWALNLMVILTAANSVLHLYASTNPGPLAPPDITPVAKSLPPSALPKVAVVLALVTLALASGSPAFAQGANAPVKPVAHHRAHVPQPLPRPSAAALEAYAAATTSTTSATKPGQLTVAQAQTNPIALLQKFTVSDLQAALTDAQGQTPPDTTAASCYQALIPIVQSNVANPLPAGPGVFQAVQKIRDAKAMLANLQSPTGPLAALNTACAPLILDAQNTLLQLGITTGAVAATVATGGVASPLTLLPFKIP